jgi:hypothetical protein
MSKLHRLQSKEYSPTPDHDIAKTRLDSIGLVKIFARSALKGAEVQHPDMDGPDLGGPMPDNLLDGPGTETRYNGDPYVVPPAEK